MNTRNKLNCLPFSLSSLVWCLWVRPGAYIRPENCLTWVGSWPYPQILVFSPGKPFQNRLMKGQEPTLKWSTWLLLHLGRLLALPTIIGPFWKGLPGGTHFNLSPTFTNYGCKKFYNIGPSSLHYKDVTIVSDTSRVVRMTIISDAPRLGVTYDCHSDDSRGFIYPPREHL